MPTFEEKWSAIEASPTYQAASPRDRKDMARFFARKVARQEVPGNHARMRSFLEKNVTGTTTRPDTKGAFGEGLREGFSQSAVGMVSRGKLPDEGMGILDAAKSLLPGGGNSLLGEGALRGAVGATGAMVGQVPDIALGMGAGSLAAKGLARAGLKAAPAALAASVGTGAVIPGGAVKIAGGTNEQALGAAALGAAGGTLPFAAPATRALGIPNPRLGPKPKPTLPNPGRGKAPMVDMRRPAPPPGPRIPESHHLPAGPMGPQPYPDWMTQGEFPAGTGIARPMPPGVIEGLPPEGGLIGQQGARPVVPPAPGNAMVPVGPVRTTYGMPPVSAPEGGMVGQQGARPNPPPAPVTAMVPSNTVNVPPGGFPPPRPQRPDALTGQFGEVPVPPARIAGLLPERVPVNVPPGGFRAQPPDAFTSPFGERPPSSPVQGAMSPATPRPPLALPPIGGTGGVIPAGPVRGPRLGATAEQQVGQRPPSPLRDPARMDDNTLLLEMQKWEREAEDMGARGADENWVAHGNRLEEELTRRGFERVEGYGWGSERHYQRPDFSKMSDEEIAAHAADLRAALGKARSAVTRGEAQVARSREMSVNQLKSKIGISGDFLEQNTNAKMLLERELQDLLGEIGHRKRIAKVSDPKGQAPAKGAVRRLIEEEEGSLDPLFYYNAAGKAVEGVRNLWRGGKTLAANAARLGASASNLANAERNVLLPGGKALYDTAERVGLNDATRAVGRLVDTALTVPLTAGPAPLRAAVNFGRRLTQSRYDVPEDVFEQKVRIAPARARANFKETEELAVDLGKRLTSGEQFDLHMQATEPTYTGAMSPDAQRVQADNQRVSDYLLKLGVITPEEHARWGKYYLPREYAIHEAPDKMGAAAFQVGQFKARIKGQDGRGTFENAGGKKAWRDYTIPEREKWGERRNVTRALALKKAKAEQNAAAAEYLDWVSQQGQYTLDPAVTNPGVAKADLPDTITGPDGRTYHLVSEGWALPGGKRRRVHRYGNLAGKYVREDVYRFTWDQALLDDIVAAGNLVTGNPYFKRLKTVWNAPNYFVNNAFHNFPMLIANGGAVSDLPAAIAKVADGDPLVAKLEADGFIKNDAMSRELALQMVDILAQQNASVNKAGPLQMSRILSDAYHGFKSLENEGYNVAQTTDDAFRVALVDRLMQDGVPYEQAAKRMNDAFYNPERVTAPAARVLGATVVPFAKVNWYVANALKETAANNPTRAAELVMMYLAAPYVVGSLLGKSRQEIDAEREALPPHMKGVGNALPIPIPGAGVPTWLGTAVGNPTQNFMATGETVIPGLPRGFQPGGLWPAALPLVQRNGVDPFTGKPINEYDQQGNVVRSGTKDYVLRNFAPGVISNTSRFADAMRGKVTPRNDVIPRPVAAARMLGLQVQPVDLERAKDLSMVLTRGDVAKYMAEARRLQRHAKALRENGQESEAEAALDEMMRYREMARQAKEAGQAKRKKMEVAP